MHEEYNDNHCRMNVPERVAYIRQGITPREVERVISRSTATQETAARRLSLELRELRSLMNDWGITATAARKALGRG